MVTPSAWGGKLVHEVLAGACSAAEAVRVMEAEARTRGKELQREAGSHSARAVEAAHLQRSGRGARAEAETWSLLWHLLGQEHEDTDDVDMEEEEGAPPVEGRAGSRGEEERTLAEAAAAAAGDNGDQLTKRLTAVCQWLEECANSELLAEEEGGGWASRLSSAEGVWRETAAKLRRGTTAVVLVRNEGGGTERGHVATALDPDAPGRQGKHLAPENEQAESRILGAVFRLIRAGRLADAVQLCREAGQPWRAASLVGGGINGPVPAAYSGHPQRVYADEKNGGELALWEDAAGEQEGILLGFQHRALWRHTCEMVAQAAASGRSSSAVVEAAVYGILSSRYDLVLPHCATWEDACWAYFKSWLDVRVDNQLVSAHEGSTVWPTDAVRRQMPLQLDDIFAKLMCSQNVTLRRSCDDNYHILQKLLILGDIPGMLDAMRDWVLNSGKTAGDAPNQLIRFAAHVVLFIEMMLPEGESVIAGDGGYSQEADAANFLILRYVTHLINTEEYEFVPIYAKSLRPYFLNEAYSHLLKKLVDEPIDVKARLLMEAAEHLPMVGTGSIHKFVTSVRENSRIPQGLAVFGGAMYRLKSTEWMCLHPELAREGRVEVTQLCREFACASAVALSILSKDSCLICEEQGDALISGLEITAVVSSNMQSAAVDVSETVDTKVTSEVNALTKFSRAEEYVRRLRILQQEACLNSHIDFSPGWLEAHDQAVIAAIAQVTSLFEGVGDGGSWMYPAATAAAAMARTEDADAEAAAACRHVDPESFRPEFCVQIAGVCIDSNGLCEVEAVAGPVQEFLQTATEGRGIDVEVFPRRDGVLQLNMKAAGREAGMVAANALAAVICEQSKGLVVTYAAATSDEFLVEITRRVCLPCLAMAVVDAAELVLSTSSRIAEATNSCPPLPPSCVFDLIPSIAESESAKLFQRHQLERLFSLDRKLELAKITHEESSKK